MVSARSHANSTTEAPLSDVDPTPTVFTTAERQARGKAARSEVPRSAHGAWEPASIRRDPVDLLEEQARTRLPELVPIRYGRMLVSPFTFFRGAAYIMAADLADGARTGLAHPTVRRRASLEFRVLRRPGSPPGVQHQRFRRDVAGTVRMGRQAAGGELRSSRLEIAGSTRGRAVRSSWRPRARTARRWRASRRCGTSTSGTRGWTQTGSCSSSRPR